MGVDEILLEIIQISIKKKELKRALKAIYSVYDVT
jgi:hypothetical protein